MYYVIGKCKDGRTVCREYNDICGALRLWSIVSDDLSPVNVKTFKYCYLFNGSVRMLRQSFISREVATSFMNDVHKEYGELVSTDELNEFLGVELANKVTTAWKAYKLSERQGGFWVLA